MVGAVVLAAGAATRMGRQKLLLPFAGDTVIGRVVGQLRAAGVADIVVVTGADANDVQRALAGAEVRIARNEDYTRGMLSSVRTGLRSAGTEWDAALLALGDQPLMSASVVRTLLAAHARDVSRIVVPVYGGRRGHPMILPRNFWEEALTRHDDIGLRGVLHAHKADIAEVVTQSEDVLSDMDTPEDYRAALARLESRGEGD